MPTTKEIQKKILSGKYSMEDLIKIDQMLATLHPPLFVLQAPPLKFPFDRDFTSDGYDLVTPGTSTIKEMGGEIAFDAVYPLLKDGKNIKGEAAVLARTSALGGGVNQEDGEIILRSKLIPADFDFYVPLTKTIWVRRSDGIRCFPCLYRSGGERLVGLREFGDGLSAGGRLFVPCKVLSA